MEKKEPTKGTQLGEIKGTPGGGKYGLFGRKLIGIVKNDPRHATRGDEEKNKLSKGKKPITSSV